MTPASHSVNYPAHFIAEVRSRVSLTSLVGRDARLERRGRLRVACCPFHAEKSPSFTIYPDQHFHCYGCGAHGDAIGYLRKRDRIDFRTAIADLAREAGMPLPDGEGSHDPARQRAAEARRAQREAEARRRQDREQARKHVWAERTAAQTSAITSGEPGEHIVGNLYLGIDRAIPRNAPYPDSIRYHAGRNALIAIATDRIGQITGGQFVHLDDQGHKLTKAAAVARGFNAPKETFGTISGSTVHLPARDRAWTYGTMPVRIIAESVEAGASIWQITGQDTDIVLGVGNLRGAFCRDRCNVVWLDDDPRGSAAWKQANRAIRAARADGCAVLIVNTWQVRQGDKSDANDILRQSGPEGPTLLGRRLSATLYPEAPRRRRVKPAEAIRQIRAAATDFMAQAIRIAGVGEEVLSAAPQVAMRGDTGIAKSDIIRRLLADAVRAVRKAGNQSPAFVFVPRIDLAGEAAEKMRAIAPDLNVNVWLGRSQPGMCSDLDSIREARARLLDPQRHVCNGCAFAEGCAYQEQREQTADIWFVAHPLLYTKPPRALSKPCLIWIDETPVDAALVGTAADDDEDARALPLDALRRRDPIAGKPDAADRLHDLRRLVVSVLETLPPGALIAAPFRRAGLTGDMCREAQKLEWSTKIEPDEGEPIERADRNLDLAARARFWLSLAALLDDQREIASGWLRIATDRDGQTVIRMRGRRAVHKAWHVPTILTDASLQIELVRHLWPSMKQVGDIAVEAPHQHIRQVIDRSYSLSSLDANDPAIADNPDPKADPKIRQRHKAERARRRRALRDVHAVLHREARVAAPGRLLAVAQKRIAEQIEAIGPLPRNLDRMHHGAVSGIDSYRTVSRIVVIGRQAPAPAAVEACAEALTGATCARLQAGHWYQRVDAVHELIDGRLVAAERDQHPDAIAEAFRRRITGLELQQIVGRGRGLWREADNPLHVLVLTDVPLELPVEELTIDAAERASFEDQQIAAGLIASQCAAHAAIAYRELWPNADRAQYARRVRGSRQPAGTVAWRYQVAGQGEKPTLTFAPPNLAADVVRAFWTDRLGPLATFERAEVQPKGSLNCQSEETAPGNSRHFGGDNHAERPSPFKWRAWQPWRVDHPPDG